MDEICQNFISNLAGLLTFQKLKTARFFQQLTDAILKIPEISEIFPNLKKIKRKLISFGFWPCLSINLINKLQVIMSFEKKRFCFYCKLDSDRLERLNKSLKTCGICKIAQYCGKKCQNLDFLPGMKQFLALTYLLKSIVSIS